MSTLEEYEQYLRRSYSREIFANYYEFVEFPTLIARREAYDDISPRNDQNEKKLRR